jgi:DNA-binding beta-propeller fold protein YncE
MKVRAIKNAARLMLAVGAAVWMSSCGGSGANQVVDTVTPATTTVVAATTQVFTSTVTGTTNLDSTWSCTYVYTPAPTQSNPNPKTTSAANCTSGQTVNGGSIGTWTTTQSTANNTLSYTAPALSKFPNPIPVITFTAAAAANTGKTGTAVLTLDTGIRVAVNPASATAPVGLSPAQQIQFTANLASGPPVGLNWQVMQPVVGSSTQICNDFPSLVANGSCGGASPLGTTCSPSCGSIDTSTGIYTAPATMPTDTAPVSSGSNASTAAPIVTVVVWKSGDIDHFATAFITLVNASTNPITFTGIQPTTIAAGGIEQDVWLSAKNILNTTPIQFTAPNGTTTTIDPTNIFTVPITANYCTPSASGVTPVVTCDASITTRIRLNPAQLALAGTGQITVSNIPSVNGQTSTISFPINLAYAKPAVVSAVPASFPQGVASSLSTDGGYYGNATNALVQVLLNGNTSVVTSTTPRQFTVPLAGSSSPQPPGLYPVSVAFSAATPPSPPPYTAAYTNVAIQPTFAGLRNAYFSPGTNTQSPTQITTPPFLALPPNNGQTNLAPSAMALNSTKGYAVITEQGTNSIQLVDLVQPSSGRATPTMVGGPVAVGNQPTGVAIDPNALSNGDDLGVVVNSGDSTLTVLDLTPTTASVVGTISLSGLIQEPPGTTAPLPFSVGIDPITHYALVAFNNATLGFVVYVNPNTSGAPACFNTSQKPPCAIASVSLNTGTNPQIALQPGAPLAYVTPGGTGVTSVVNMLLNNTTVAIAPSPNGASCTNGIATITTNTPNNLNPSSPGAVLIAGVTPAGFNGTYNVNAGTATTFTFTYPLSCTTNGLTNGITGGGGSVTFGNPYFTFSTTPTAAGAAINQVNRVFAYADPNASTAAPQIGFINALDQSVTSLFLTLGSCNGCNPIPSGAPEVGTRSVSWDPFTNVLVAYNPSTNYNLISLINPGGPTATGSSAAYRIIQAISTCPGTPNTTCNAGQGSYTPSGGSAVTVYGPMAYDPKTNLVLVANAGSNTLSYLDLDPSTTFKKVSINTLQVTLGGVPSAQPPLASAPGAPNPLPVATCDPTNPTNPYASCFPQSVTVGKQATMKIFGQGFASGGAPVVRLDGDPTGVTVTTSTDSEVDVNIAASRLANPHTFALDVVSGSEGSNVQNVYAVGVVDLSKTCSNADMPEGVAYDYIRNVAVVTNFGCNSMSIINMDASNVHNYGVPYGAVMSTVTVGTNPLGVDVIPRLGYAVVANNADGSASLINIANPLAPQQLSFTSASCTTSSGTTSSTNICVGIAPSGVAIAQDRALALVANTGGNSVSAIDLTPLLQTNSADCPSSKCVPAMQLVATSGPPTAIAVDPNRDEAVVTNIQNTGTTSATGGLDVISLASNPPTRSSTASINSITANPTGIVFDPAITQTCTSITSCVGAFAPGLFYVSSTQQNAVYSFNPDTSTATPIRVGVNPYSLGYNYQTGTLLTINSTSNTSSIVDTVGATNSVFSTRNTLGIGSQSQFAVAVDNVTSTAVIADQNNNRVLILALPQ